MTAAVDVRDRSSRPFGDHELDAEILERIITASSDPCWCMDFGDPVDLTAPDHEIVRQVFENNPFWRFTNPAMARLYLLEPGVDFNSRPTAEIFPRNVQNEEFVMRLIANGFEVDAAPALDTRYDGVQIYVENDVRAHIVGGHLLRMFGIVRDVGKHRLREERMLAELNEALEVLESLPNGVLAFNDDCEVVVANPSACRILNTTADALLGGELSRNPTFSNVIRAIGHVAVGSMPSRVTSSGVEWSLAPRAGGGVVASLSPRSGEGTRP